MDPAPDPRSGDARWIALRLTAAALLLVGFVFALSRVAGPRLEPLAAGFVARFGYLGMALGAFVTDATTLPVPPQFYMLTAVSAHSRPGRLSVLKRAQGSSTSIPKREAKVAYSSWLSSAEWFCGCPSVGRP